MSLVLDKYEVYGSHRWSDGDEDDYFLFSTSCPDKIRSFSNAVESAFHATMEMELSWEEAYSHPIKCPVVYPNRIRVEWGGHNLGIDEFLAWADGA